MSRPIITYDDARQVMTIEGVNYAYAFFHMFGKDGAGVGQILQVDRRHKNEIVLQRRYDLEKQEEDVTMLAEVERTMIPPLGQKEIEALLAHCSVLTSGQDVPQGWCRTEAVHEAYVAMGWGAPIFVRHGILFFAGSHQHSRSVFYLSPGVKERLRVEIKDATKALYKIVYGKEYDRDDVCPVCSSRPACESDCR